uniref:Dymeclin n=1 Tax=Macrostomum lignano TaxID=282301 RepID=A0A1I8JIZ4_9PLAT
QQQQQQPLFLQAVSLFVNFLVGSEENPSGTGLKRKRRSVLDSEVSHASDMPKRQECALTISSEHSDLAAASVIWFTCCSQAAAAAAAIRAGTSILISPLHPSFGSLAAHKPQQQQQQQPQQQLSVQAVSLFVNFLVDLKKTHSEVSHASDMPKRQECALTISSEHSDLAAASVIWFTCCSQAQQQQQQPLSVQAVSLFVNFLVDLKKTRPAQD